MSRRHRAEKRETEPDPVYKSVLLAKFINKVMIGGKKSVARAIVYAALNDFANKVKRDNPLEAFEEALENAKPQVEVKSRRIGGATYQVPVEMGWIIQYSRGRAGRSMPNALAQELADCLGNQGTTIKKKEDTHRMAEANKAFAHFKW